MNDVRWLASYADAGEVVFRIGRTGDQLIAEWIGLARLSARRDGSESRLEIVPGSDPREVGKIERGSARLLLRQAAGHLALHGSAVELGGRVHVLLGRSGAGKSTLAAWLCARAGATLFADDAVAIDPVAAPADGVPTSWVVEAVEREHWLDDEARRAVGLGLGDQPAPPASSGKRPLPSGRPGAGRAPLVAFIELVFADVRAPRLTRLHGVEALAALVPQAVRFVIDEPDLHRRELDRLAELVDRVGVYKLERSQDLAQLDECAALIQNSLPTHEVSKGREP